MLNVCGVSRTPFGAMTRKSQTNGYCRTLLNVLSRKYLVFVFAKKYQHDRGNFFSAVQRLSVTMNKLYQNCETS